MENNEKLTVIEVGEDGAVQQRESTWDDYMKLRRDEAAAALAATQEWQHALKPGDLAVRFNGETIEVYRFDDGGEDAMPLQEGFAYATVYTSITPEGEGGVVHRSWPQYRISPEQFAVFEQAGFPDKDHVDFALLLRLHRTKPGGEQHMGPDVPKGKMQIGIDRSSIDLKVDLFLPTVAS